MGSQRIPRALPALLLLLLGFLEGRTLLGPEARQYPWVEDEQVYLFQAKQLASGHLSLPSPPLPEFFEAAHLIVVPRFAAKYLPGHALVLAPFEAIGAPWFAPALELGLFAALLCALALAAGFSLGSASLAGLLPLATAEVASLFGTYLSWTTSLPLTAGALAALILARRTRSPLALALASTLAGLLFWTRPFTGLALYATLGIVAVLGLPAVRSRRRWLLAAAAPLAIWIALTCAVCKSVTGQATELPWTLYARQYMPDDGPGFGPTRAQLPERTAPEYLRVFIDELHAQRERYTLQVALSRIPEHLCTVTTFLPSELLWPLALLGLLLCADALLPVLLFALLFFLLQLTFYAPTPFYLLELAIPLSLGLAGAADKLFRAIRAMQSRALRLGALVAASLPAMALVAGAVDSMDTTKRRANAPNALARAEANLAPAAAVHGLVFIRYANRNSSPALHYNEPDLQRTPLLRALDLGPRNRELRALFPERPAFLYEVATGALTAL